MARNTNTAAPEVNAVDTPEIAAEAVAGAQDVAVEATTTTSNKSAVVNTTANEPKEKTVRIKIPRTNKEQEDVFVSVNERTWMIKRGEYVNVPECVAEVLEHQENALVEAYEFEQSALNEA